MKDKVDEVERNERLYIEIWFAEMSTSNMKRSSAVFRLKKNYKKLDSEDYAHNLRVYFGCVNSVNTVTLSDFSYILTGLNAACSTAAPTQNELTEPEQQKNTVQTREHIAVSGG